MDNRHLQWLLLLAAAAATTCLTNAKVRFTTEEYSDDEITISSREASRSEPPSRNEPTELPSRNESPEFPSRNEPPELPSRNEPPELPSRNEPPELQSRVQQAKQSNDSGKVACDESTSTCKAGSVKEGLHDQVTRLTNELSKAVAALKIAQHRERKLTVLEREKYSYVKVATDKVLGLVDNMQHAENRLSADTCLERQIQQRLACTHRTQGRSHRRSQLIRRLLSGAEVGLMHLDSGRMLSTCHANAKVGKPQTRSHVVPH